MSSPDTDALEREVRAELEYLLTAAEKPGVISHHDAEDAETRLLAHVTALADRVKELERIRAGQLAGWTTEKQMRERAEAEVQRLREALERCADASSAYGIAEQGGAREIARAALSEEPQ